MPMFCSRRVSGLVAIGLLTATTAWADLPQAIRTLRSVGREGQGNRSATKAWAELAAVADASQLTVILASIDGATPLAANWLRAAVDAVAERQLKQAGTLPVAELERFLADKTHDQRARRLAYDWIVRADPGASERLIPTMLDDPSLELRRDAVARVIQAAETAQAAQQTDVALASYRQALNAARDLDQVNAIAEALKKAGQGVDLAHHFGFVIDWMLVGPFDNHAGKGFALAYPPEQAVDLRASHDGLGGKVVWIASHTDDEYGNVDLNKALGKQSGVAAYAFAEFQSDRHKTCELRLGSQNAIKIWLNGKLLTSVEVYHANGTMDQYVGRGELKPGRNEILLKICQNEQKEDWAQDWQFQLRVCDVSGKAILATDRPSPRPRIASSAGQPAKE
jgi:hypothetical protein